MTKYVRLNAVHRAQIESLHQLGHTQDEIAWQTRLRGKWARLNPRSVGNCPGCRGSTVLPRRRNTPKRAAMFRHWFRYLIAALHWFATYVIT